MVKISIDELYKLNDRDREIFDRKYALLKEDYQTNYFNIFLANVNQFIYLIGYFLILIPLYYLAFGKNILIPLLKGFDLVIQISVFVLSFMFSFFFIIYLFKCYSYHKYKKELINEYFDVKEVNLKKKVKTLIPKRHK